MKKTTLIAAICIMFAATAHTQEITPIQLKQARMAAYQWYDNYEDRIGYNTRSNAISRFLDLFANDSVIIPNDLIYQENFDFDNQSISVDEYAERLFSETSLYIPVFVCSNMAIIEETKKNNTNTIEYILTFKKSISANEKGIYTNDRRAYPEMELDYTCYLTYKIESCQIYASKVMAHPVERFVLLKESDGYTFSTREKLLQECSARKKALISYYIVEDKIDRKIQSLQADTMKYNVHVGAQIGASFVSAEFANKNVMQVQFNPGLSAGINFGMYFQFSLKGRNRWGLEISPAFHISNISLGCNFYEAYTSIDPDGGRYERQVTVSNYAESIWRYQVVLPVTLRYDYFLQENLTIFARLGLGCSYDMLQQLSASGTALYAGYYDWLFGITMNQNGIYDFGSFELSQKSQMSAISKFGLNAHAGLGIQYFIPNSKWSLEGAIQYDNIFYNKINPMDNYHLSDNITEWHSLTNLLSRFNSQKLLICINFTRNF